MTPGHEILRISQTLLIITQLLQQRLLLRRILTHPPINNLKVSNFLDIFLLYFLYFFDNLLGLKVIEVKFLLLGDAGVCALVPTVVVLRPTVVFLVELFFVQSQVLRLG
jgi:hypothetical protein